MIKNIRSREKRRSSRNITEEEIAEYLAKKAQKKMRFVSPYYSNDSNPFGDSNLDEKFVWRKKIQRDVAQGVPLDLYYSVKAGKKRQRERMDEIESLKKRREERAIQKAKHEEAMAMIGRERARTEFQDWEKKEEEFDFDQSKLRSEIRLREGRAKPIDVLYKYINGGSDVDMGTELNEPPYTVFKGLTVKEMEELHDDIKMHLDLDRATPTHTTYWEALMVVCNWKLGEARKKDALERGLPWSIEEDVRKLLEGKTQHELEELQANINSQMRAGTALVVEYWEAVLKQLHIFKAKACLKEMHFVPKHSQCLDEQPCDQAVKAMEEGSTVYGSGAEVDELESETLRKPKYLSRVYTGYEWNKYNRIHYDHDNPPPKIVQGYKFSIFYPDLLDKAKVPTYTIEKDGNKRETCIIRFHAGPPYDDIGFRIVNKDWECSRKRGFKCTFEGGILHLHFKFKCYSYRR